MPFKSEAQRARCKQLVLEGKMSQATYDEYEKSTGDATLPEKAAKTYKPKGQVRGVRKVR